MDTRRLRYFVVVAEEASFTKAAEKLHMAQPPLSKRIQEIEEEVGVSLIDRRARPLRLTAAGQLFYEQSLLVLQRLDQLSATMRTYREAARPRLTIGLISLAFHERLPQFIRRYSTRAPNVDVVLTEMSSADQIKALQEGRIDVGLGRALVSGQGIRQDVLRYEPLLAVVPSQGAGKILSDSIDVPALGCYPLILYASETSQDFGGNIISIFRDRGRVPARVIEVGEMQTALIMVAAGAGITLIPASAKRLVHSDAVCLPIMPIATTPVVIARRRGDVSPQVGLLLQTIKDLYPEWGHAVPSGMEVADRSDLHGDE